MKATFPVTVLSFLAIGVLSGCKSNPYQTGYVTPTRLVSQIDATDHIVVKSLLSGHPGAPKFTTFSETITGHEMKQIIHDISLLREPTYGNPTPLSDCWYDWQLQFYQGTKLLGTADLADCLIRCDGVEYHISGTLKSLYQHIVKESGEEN